MIKIRSFYLVPALVLFIPGAVIAADNNPALKLFEAAGNAGILRELIEEGADPLVKDSQGKTLLHYAARSGDWTAIPYLIELGIPVDSLDETGFSPLMDAVDFMPRQYNENILILLEWGADVHRRFPGGKTILQRYLEGFDKDTWLKQGPSAVVVKKMLDQGLEPGIKDTKGNSALRIALQHGEEKYIDTRAIDLIKAAASGEDLALIDSMERRKDRAAFMKVKLPLVIPALVIPLGLAGLSISMRESVYKGNPPDNWMVPVNSFLGMGLGAGALSAVIMGGIVYAVKRDSSDGPGLAITLSIAGGIAGFAAGTMVSMLPVIRDAFVEYPGLYYMPTALAVAAGGIMLFKVSVK